MAEEILDARTAALAGLFDDAAMFPPANRSLAESLAAHRGHRRRDRSWLVRRLLVTASRVNDLMAALGEDDHIEVGVVLDRGGAGTFAETVSADISSLARLARDERVDLTGIEVRVVGEDPEAEVSAVLTGIQGARLPRPPQVAIEVPVTARPAGEVLTGLKAIEVARHSDGVGRSLMAKVRCGGTERGTVPADVELAGFLMVCATSRIPFKATAGLHHPTRTENPDTGDLEHGFLNLLGAAVNAFQGAGLAAIEETLARPPAELRLGSGALVIGDAVVESVVLGMVRASFFTGIGCCDVLDPITDLAALNVLDSAGGLG